MRSERLQRASWSAFAALLGVRPGCTPVSYRGSLQPLVAMALASAILSPPHIQPGHGTATLTNVPPLRLFSNEI